MIRKFLAFSMSLTLILSGCGQGIVSTPPGNGNSNTTPPTPPPTPTTASAAIKHVVVIFGENESFDHYFGTYPNAANTPGDPVFTAAAGTPTPNNYISNPSLLSQNPNLASNGAANATNGASASNPFRLARSQAWTASQNHNYGPEQSAFNGGKMDSFPKFVGTANSSAQNAATGTVSTSPATTTALTMGYYDGNTVTALWNYAQHYAMNDHSFGTVFGPSTNGAINVVSGQTNGVDPANSVNPGSAVVSDGSATGLTDIGDADPTGDICSSTTQSIRMTGKNIGDLLNTAGITWGWFQGGFDLTVTNPNGTTGCNRSTVSAYTGTQADNSPHHQPFQYYASTANFNHTRPTSPTTVGTASDPAHHQYDIHDFTDALAAGNLPAVSYLKAARYQDAHASNSDPLDEQTFIVNIVNAIEKSSFWSSTAIIIAYDDSDGWYDHVYNPVNGSATSADTLNGAGVCISATAAAAAWPGVDPATLHAQGRCGYGPRLPFLVISPWAKKNFLDTTVTDQASVVRFIEDVFLSSQRIGGGSADTFAGSIMNMFDFSNGAAPPNPNVVQLNPTTGLVTSGN
ncbi:MAG TPA: alkaline phosphatase family protein [Edaphobacter sp.]|jgi:phospholipase C|nr:alkaline phosphatase family protein [Edaphobacter sp.]